MILLVVVSSGACGPAPIVSRPEDRSAMPAREVGSPDGGTGRALPVGAVKPMPAREVPTPDGGTSPTQPADGGTGPAQPADGGMDADATAPREKLPPPDAGARTDVVVTGGAGRAPRIGELAVVEALVNPTGQDVGREWIELVSLAAEPIDLSALHVADLAVDVAAPAGSLSPGGRVVIGQSADLAMNGGAPVAAAYGTRLMLNNDGEELSLCLGPCAEGVILDRATWGELGAGYDGHALLLDRGAGAICPAQQPFGTAGDFGTPGQADVGCAQPDGGF